MLQIIILVISLQGQGLSAPEALDVRYAIEDKIMEATGDDVIGGQVATDGSEVIIEIETKNSKITESYINFLLKEAGLEGKYEIRKPKHNKAIKQD
jgi:hypothetical protein